MDLADPKFYQTPPVDSVKADKLPGRKSIKDFFLKKFISVDSLHKVAHEALMFENDQRARVNLVQGPMTTAYNSLLLPYNKTLFGRPPQFLLMEHLALTMSVEHLRHIFLASLKGVSERLNRDASQLLTERRLLLEAVREWAMKEFPRELYT